MNKERSSELNKFGLIATGIYLFLLLTLIPLSAYLGWITLDPLRLNELGDFLAGAFGPLAIFWLVLGFFQQGRELQNSIETLKLQANELANSVQQQKDLVSVTKEGLEHDRELLQLENDRRKKALLPAFDIHYTTSLSPIGYTSRKMEIENTGASIYDVNISIMDKNRKTLSNQHMTLFQNSKTEEINLSGSSDIEYPIKLKISYDNSEGMPCENNYQTIVAHESNTSDKFRTEEIKTEELQCS